MWGHQYDQQPNQVMVQLWRTATGRRTDPIRISLVWSPTYGCCTANMHQGWPKFAASFWMAVPGDGLARGRLCPERSVHTMLGSVPVTIIEDTEYPFRDRIKMTANPAKPIRFPLVLRIPGWAKDPRVTVNGDPVNDVQAWPLSQSRAHLESR